MRKLFLLLIIFFSFLSVRGQEELFLGIKSGMSKADYISYCVDNENISISVYETFVDFNGLEFRMESKFNNEKLVGLTLISRTPYDKETYIDLKKKVNKVNEYFKIKYGEKKDGVFSNSSDIENIRYSLSNTYTKRTLLCMVYISESIDEFRILLYITDRYYE